MNDNTIHVGCLDNNALKKY